MSVVRNRAEVLEQEFLPLRAKILEIAAGLDRLDRAQEGAATDGRRQRLGAAIEMLLSEDPGRAERVQLLFSREFESEWREKFGV